jgi:hypothetical protein
VTGSTESDAVTARSARGDTVVEAVELLFAFDGSETSEDTVAVFDSGPEAPAVTTMLMLAVPEAEIVPREHVTVPAAWLQDPCDGVAEEYDTPPGSGSLTTTLVASEGPAFATFKV